MIHLVVMARTHGRDTSFKARRRYRDLHVGMAQWFCKACESSNVYAPGERPEACRMCGTPIPPEVGVKPGAFKQTEFRSEEHKEAFLVERMRRLKEAEDVRDNQSISPGRGGNVYGKGNRGNRHKR